MKVLPRLFIASIFFLLNLTGVKAQIDSIEPVLDTVKIAPAYQGGTFFGQNHTYSVVFRGNGEAVVSARVVVGNSGDEALKEVNLRVPGVQASGIYVFQMFKEKQCVRYSSAQYDPATRIYPPRVCEEYRDPDYYNDYSYYNVKYKKAEFEYENDTITVKLPESISAGKSGAFFLYFRAAGYAKKNAYGAYDYTFESLQAEDSIRNMSIGLSTDSDLYMKGVSGEVNYRFEDATASIMNLGAGSGAEKGVASPMLDSYVSSIGTGSIYKSASNLSPLESYKVEGAYADSRGKLYGKEILIGGLVVLGIVVLMIVLVVVILKLLRKSNPPAGKKDVVLAVEEKQSIKTSSSGGKMFAVIVLIGFIVSLLMSVYTVMVVVFSTFATRNIDYSFRNLISIVLVIVSILIYSLLVFSPGVLIGVKRGAGWGIGTVVSTVLWLIFWIVLIFLGMFLFGKSIGGGVYDFIRPLTSGSGVMY